MKVKIEVENIFEKIVEDLGLVKTVEGLVVVCNKKSDWFEDMGDNLSADKWSMFADEFDQLLLLPLFQKLD